MIPCLECDMSVGSSHVKASIWSSRHTYCGYETELYTIPANMVKVGQIAVAVFPEDNNWHRCIVTRIRDNAFVEVLYVDYGNSGVVPINGLKFLK